MGKVARPGAANAIHCNIQGSTAFRCFPPCTWTNGRQRRHRKYSTKKGFPTPQAMAEPLELKMTLNLPRCSHACSFWFQTRCPQERRHRIVELRVSIQDHIAIGAGFRKRGTYLLDDPIRRWVPRDIEVQDLTTGVLDHEEVVQQIES